MVKDKLCPFMSRPKFSTPFLPRLMPPNWPLPCSSGLFWRRNQVGKEEATEWPWSLLVPFPLFLHQHHLLLPVLLQNSSDYTCLEQKKLFYSQHAQHSLFLRSSCTGKQMAMEGQSHLDCFPRWGVSGTGAQQPLAFSPYPTWWLLAGGSVTGGKGELLKTASQDLKALGMGWGSDVIPCVSLHCP